MPRARGVIRSPRRATPPSIAVVTHTPSSKIAIVCSTCTATEPSRVHGRMHEVFADYDRVHEVPLVKLMSHNVQQTVDHLTPVVVIVATATGHRARLISRFKLPVWIVAVSQAKATCQGLQFSYGVLPIHEPRHPQDWSVFARRWVHSQGLAEGLVVLTEGPNLDNPKANHRLEVIDLSQGSNSRRRVKREQ